VEAGYDAKYQALLERHQQELQKFQPESKTTTVTTTTAPMEKKEPEKQETNTQRNNDKDDDEEQVRQKKLSKKMQKRQQQRDREREREQAILEETARVGPTPREIEMQQIQSILAKLAVSSSSSSSNASVSLIIQEVPADGHCLYRAVAKQLSSSSSEVSHVDVRNWVAHEMERHSEEYAPFCEYNHEDEDEEDDFAAYVDRVRNTATWGGHLELQALASLLNRPIEIYQASHATPLVIVGRTHDPDDHDAEPTMLQYHHLLPKDTTPIRLSYHRHYYSLGEHYNCVVVAQGAAVAGVVPSELE
jgi:OTU domain-containing protein 6